MADDLDGDRLRQMAEHRGLKLLKSRRRKPGAGDYGMFGLTDASGKALLGIGGDGLTASAEDVETYLRSGSLGSWQQSASTVPDIQPAKAPQAAPTEPKTRQRRGTPVGPAARDAGSRARAGAATSPSTQPLAKPAPAPEPQLVLRPATPADADDLVRLLSGLSGIISDAATARRNLAAVRKTGGGVLLAELGKPIGCCGWAIVQTAHRGPIGRITVLFVDEDHRRKGIAARLLSGAEQALAGAGCTLVEAMSDILINNAHNFFRALKFEQASYRFTRKLPE